MIICIFEINLSEAAVVFDKYQRKFRLDSKNRFQTMMGELNMLERFSTVDIYPISIKIINNAIKMVLEQHVYIVDAIQLEASIEARVSLFCSTDKELNTIAMKIGLKTII